MAHYICPCCGQRFNGKKCRNCLYVTFDDEIERNLHTHQEANVPDTSRPVTVQLEWEQQKRDFRRMQERKRQQKKSPKWLIWLLVFMLLEPALLIIGEMADEISSLFETSFAAATREAVPAPDVAIPENARRVFSADGLTVYLGEDDSTFTYPLYLKNETDQDVRLAASRIIVDGFLSEQSGAYANALSGTTRDGELWLDAEDMQYATMDVPHQIQVDFYFYDTISYEDLLTGTFTIGTEHAEKLPPPAGDVLLESDTVLIKHLGYKANGFAPEFCEGVTLFYLENTTGSTLSIYAEAVRMDGKDTGLSLWTQLPPGCRTVTRMWLYALEDLGIKTMADARPLEMDMAAYCEETGELTELGTVTVSFS